MKKTRIEQKLMQIIQAANSLTVSGESNAAQIIGITSAAREVWQLVNEPEKKEEVKDDG